MLFSEFDLDSRLMKSFGHFGFEHTTEIQARAIPEAMAGKDLLASSKTGSGKTLAYLLPAVHRLYTRKALAKRDPRVLILVPTRELAKQVYATLRTLITGTRFSAILVLGGENFNDQHKNFQKEPHFVVATPGRMADHLKQRHVFLEGLEMLILDEADRMLDLGFAADLRAINNAANHRRRQTLFFSATLDDTEVNELAQELLYEPVRVAIGHSQDEHQDIKQHVYLCDHLDHKQALLQHFLDTLTIKQAIVFTATKQDTVRLAELLAGWGLTTGSLNGDMSQSARSKVMDDFARGKFNVLVSTDLASRGLDIASVSHVFNFDIPKPAEEFVHRTGRTGRAGFQGDAISFVGPKDWFNFKEVEHYLKRTFSTSTVEGLEPTFTGITQKRAPQKKAKQKAPVKNKAPKAQQKPAARKKVVFHDNEQQGFEPFRLPKKSTQSDS
ncbi:Superfamily II DNA and RNA helicase [Marinomonas fungiae]|uniref:Superfamily II DNA and RNA helicase n=1 Tax=Marinomonas fungiae TaxID=1137284 RepID=A0A0K6IGS7_9GAMM|nr:Superfamily II DNA and RNA helicase [Marinomonas fungiae]